MTQKRMALRDENARLGQESHTLKQAQALLAALAVNVSRGDEETVDIPKELRRIAHSLGTSAETLGQIAMKSAAQEPEDSLTEVRDTVCTLKRKIQEKRRETERSRKLCPPGLRSQLREMDTLLERLCEVSGQAAQTASGRKTGASCLGFQKMLLKTRPRIN